MRLGLVILGALLVTGLSKTASAEQRTGVSRWSQPALEAKLLDGWRARESRAHLGGPSTQREAAEPGQELSLAVERMWSQVRAYKRPGGAELIVRGRF